MIGSRPLDLTMKPVTSVTIAESRKESLLRRCSASLYSEGTPSIEDSDPPFPAPPPRATTLRKEDLHPKTEKVEDMFYCNICQERAQYKILRNYGAFSCFSCRAFFRRAHESCAPGEAPSFKCRVDKLGNNPARRKRCRHCRLQRCFAEGMKSENIMKDEVKRKRFKHYDCWKTSGGKSKRQNIPENVSSETKVEQSKMVIVESREEEPNPDLKDVLQHDAMQSKTPPPPLCSASEDFENPSKEDTCADKLPSDYSHWLDALNNKLAAEVNQRQVEPQALPCGYLAQRRLESVRHSYKAAMYNPELYQRMVGLVTPLGDGSASKLTRFDRLQFAQVLRSVEQQFYTFATAQPAFHALPQEDRKNMFATASRLFVHLLLAKTFVARTGFQQLYCLVGSSVTETPDSRNLARVSFREFSCMTGFFSAGQSERETRYMLLIFLRLRTLPILSLDLAILANILLFAGLKAAVALNPYALGVAHAEAIELAGVAGLGMVPPIEVGTKNVEVFLEVLEAMKDLHLEQTN